MKTYIVFAVISTFLFDLSKSQIKTTPIAPPQKEHTKQQYDSLKNFLGDDVYLYKGQDLYLKGMPVSSRAYGYRGFFNHIGDGFQRANIYKNEGSLNSDYDKLAGKYFRVLDIYRHPEAEQYQSLYGNTFYLLIQEKESKDSAYFKYQSDDGFSFPFIVVGFYEKQKQLRIGVKYVFCDEWIKNSTDVKTGKPLNLKTGGIWKCVDLIVEEKQYILSLIFENASGEQISLPYSDLFEVDATGRAYTTKQADKYKTKFGHDNWERILKGKVKIGMTKEMCRLAWGEPNDINKTISSTQILEQWVYDANYLYFQNGILTTIQ